MISANINTTRTATRTLTVNWGTLRISGSKSRQITTSSGLRYHRVNDIYGWERTETCPVVTTRSSFRRCVSTLEKVGSWGRSQPLQLCLQLPEDLQDEHLRAAYLMLSVRVQSVNKLATETIRPRHTSVINGPCDRSSCGFCGMPFYLMRNRLPQG